MTNPNPAQTPPLPPLTEETPPRILLLDDDKRVLELLQLTLQGRGYVVETCLHGEAALDRLFASREKLPDLVVVDLQLPRRSAVTICQKIREDPSTRDLPLIVISGQVAMETRIQVLRAGADDLVTKPFSPRELILRVQKLLRRVSRVKKLEERVLCLEEELQRERGGFQEAHRSNRLLRRSFMDGMSHLAEAFLSAGRLEQALTHFVAVRWSNGPFAYLLQDDDGVLRPLVSRCVPDQVLPGLTMDASSWKEIWPFPSGAPVFVEEIPSGSPLAKLRHALTAGGLRLLIPTWVGDAPIGMLALGEQVVEGLTSRDELEPIRGVGLAFYTFWHRSRLERGNFLRLGELAAMWIDSEEQKDPSLRGHSHRVAQLCQHLGRQLGLGDDQVRMVTLAGSLHRLGKTSQPCCHGSPISLATESQWPRVTEEREDLFAILRHQEEVWNGTGRPEGLAGPSIPLGSRILALADRCDVEILVGGRDVTDVVAEIQKQAGVLWDPDLVRVLAERPLHEMLRLEKDDQNPAGRSST